MSDQNQQPVTKQDVIDLEQRLTKNLTESLTKNLTESVQEMVRDAQTEILRGFERYSRSQDMRLRKLEADYSNLNTSESLRIAMLEERVTSIERKLLSPGPPRPQ